jgi:hypothetical protein
MHWTLNIAIAFLLLGLTEAFIKPLAKHLMRRKIMKVAPAVLERIDLVLPTILTRGSGENIDAYTRRLLQELTDEDWSDADIEPIFSLFDIRSAADRLLSEKI